MANMIGFCTTGDRRGAPTLGGCLLALVASCGGGGSFPDAAIGGDAMTDAHAPDFNGADVVLDNDGISVYINFAASGANGPRFPQIGDCEANSDAYPIVASCLDSVSVDGQALATDSSIGASNPYRTSVVAHSGALLVISGCGESVSVPLAVALVSPATDVTAMSVGADVTVSWTTNAPTTLVSIGGGFGGSSCNETVLSHTFAGWGQSSSTVAGTVEPLSTPRMINTILGDIRVWSGYSSNYSL